MLVQNSNPIHLLMERTSRKGCITKSWINHQWVRTLPTESRRAKGNSKYSREQRRAIYWMKYIDGGEGSTVPSSIQTRPCTHTEPPAHRIQHVKWKALFLCGIHSLFNDVTNNSSRSLSPHVSAFSHSKVRQEPHCSYKLQVQFSTKYKPLCYLYEDTLYKFKDSSTMHLL